ncbi:unnamed protein product [Cuscuta campestris]|uniref:Uncharacterized protein n=1 Tax=Cuscuta campestris TaxID=132261 RepID=A0A484KUF3_9ASTE|nr:unnamed protein product [Cuscuta campestris]
MASFDEKPVSVSEDAVDSAAAGKWKEYRSEIVECLEDEDGLEPKGGPEKESGDVDGSQETLDASDGGSGGADNPALFKSVFRASSLVHSEVKESPLSSDAIFQQVCVCQCVYYCSTSPFEFQ